MDVNTATTTILDLVNSFSGKTSEFAGKYGTEAASASKDLWFGFLGIDWSTPTWDLVILLFFIISVLIYSFTLGRDRIVAILISTYLALAVATNFPFINQLTVIINKSGIFAFQVSAFLIIFALLFFFLSRSQLVQSLANLSGSWWQIILFSLLQVGLLISIILSFLPEIALQHLSIFTKTIFLSDLGRFCWIILPIIALVFVQRKPKKRRWPFGRLDDYDF